MINESADGPMVALSVKVYQMLLFAYPNKFQQAYGLHMSQVFRDCCLRAFRQGGMNGIFKLWAVTFLDLIQSVISEHSQKEVEMKKEMKPEEIRRAGWALIFGAISFVLSIVVALLDTSEWSVFALILLVFISQPLLVFGVLGLRNRYGEIVGSFGRNILLVGAILGPLTSVIGLFLMAIEPLWFIVHAGPAILFICLTLFGVAAVRTKPLQRWNLLPVVAGFSYPALLLSYIVNAWIAGDWSGDASMSDTVIMTLIVIQGFALVALGQILKGNAPEKTAVVA